MKILLKNKISQIFISLISLIFFIPYKICVKKMNLNILDPEDTIEFLLKHKTSLGRFGDGEINILFKNKSIGFQSSSVNLKRDLGSIKENKNFKIAIPYAFKSTKEDKLFIKAFWWRYVTFNFSNLVRFCKYHTNFFLDTNFGRVITELKDKKKIAILIKKICKLWESRDVIIVEGEYTRFGVGNDLLKKTNSVSRIIAPAKNAYSKVDDIYNQTLNIAKKFDRPLILISLGPTATVLAYKFSESYQAIDIGHFDLQYQYLQEGFYHRVKIDSRYDNEMLGGNEVKNIKDRVYESEIKAVIK